MSYFVRPSHCLYCKSDCEIVLLYFALGHCVIISVAVINLLCSYKISFLITHVSIKSAVCKVKLSLRKILKSTREECNRNMF